MVSTCYFVLTIKIYIVSGPRPSHYDEIINTQSGPSLLHMNMLTFFFLNRQTRFKKNSRTDAGIQTFVISVFCKSPMSDNTVTVDSDDERGQKDYNKSDGTQYQNFLPHFCRLFCSSFHFKFNAVCSTSVTSSSTDRISRSIINSGCRKYVGSSSS